MAHKLRGDAPRAVFQVTGRVNWQVWHLVKPGFFERFLAELKAAAAAFSIDLLAVVFMSNHYHCVARSPGEARYRELTSRRTRCYHIRPWPKGHLKSSVLSQWAHRYLGRVSTHFQEKLGIKGHFWEERYHASRLDDAWNLVVRLAYDHRNPVRAGIVLRPEDYPWSSAAWWATGESEIFSIPDDCELPFGLSFETLRSMLLDYQRSKLLDDAIQALEKQGCRWSSPGGLERLREVLKESGLPVEIPRAAETRQRCRTRTE